MNFLKSSLFLCLVTFLFAFNSCTKKDDVPPYMKLYGAADTSIRLNSKFHDPGAYAKDETDGLLQVAISGLFNPDSLGTYTRSYLASDNENNTTELTRIIRVQSDVSSWAGAYNVSQFCSTGGSSNFTDPVRPSNSKNNHIVLNLGNYSPSYNVEAEIKVADSSITVHYQSKLTNQVPIREIRFSSTYGRLTSSGFTLNYNIVEVDTSGLEHTNQCNATYER